MRALALLLLLASPAAAQPRGAAPARRKLAGLVVRSHDWAVHRGTDTVEVWTGDVSYRHQGREIYADRAERRHSTDRWLARGHVRAVWRLADKTVLRALGEEARHSGDADTGSLKPAPGAKLQFQREAPELAEPDRGEARRMDWDLRGHRISLEGEVRIWGPSGRAWADRARYDTESRRLSLDGGRPVLASGAKDWDGAVQADRVEAADHPRRIVADGQVRGWVIFRDRPEKFRGL